MPTLELMRELFEALNGSRRRRGSIDFDLPEPEVLLDADGLVEDILPAERNMDCRPAGRPVATLIMNGTADPMNPWEGGDVALYGLVGNRGAVLSSEDSIDYFRDIAGHTGAPIVAQLPERNPGDGSRVEVRRWDAPGRKPVALYAILNGGHNAPHPELQLPRLPGPTNHDIRAAEEIWRFFAASASEASARSEGEARAKSIEESP